jgi:hypothetical protein
MKTRTTPILITLLCAAMTSMQNARAATITVTNTNDSGAGCNFPCKTSPNFLQYTCE